MVLAATAWMLSAAYVTLHKRHIGITVFYIMASDRGKWWLDFIAYVVGIIALWLLIDDSVIRALDSVMMLEKAGSAWNSPQPMILKSMLTIGATTYIFQLMINLYRHFSSNIAKKIGFSTLWFNNFENHLRYYSTFYRRREFCWIHKLHLCRSWKSY